MKLWLFTFLNPQHPLVYAKVAAEDKADACSLLQPILPDEVLMPRAAIDIKTGAPRYTLQYVGMMQDQNRSVLTVTTRAR